MPAIDAVHVQSWVLGAFRSQRPLARRVLGLGPKGCLGFLPTEMTRLVLAPRALVSTADFYRKPTAGSSMLSLAQAPEVPTAVWARSLALPVLGSDSESGGFEGKHHREAKLNMSRVM